MEQPNNVVHAGEATAGKLIYFLLLLSRNGAKILKIFVSGSFNVKKFLRYKCPSKSHFNNEQI